MENQQIAETGFWSTVSKLAVAVPLAGLIGAGMSAIALGGVDYGQLRSSLDTEKNRSAKLEKTNEEYRQANEKWRDAYTKQDSELSAANARLAAMQNDQCATIMSIISDLKFQIEQAYGYNDSDQKRADLQVMMRQYQESLQACFSSRK